MAINQWNITVDEIVRNFHDALGFLYPCLKKVNLPVSLPDAYDSWDEITEVLYKNLVVDVMRYGLSEDQMHLFSLPVYEAFYSSYFGLSIIEVVPNKPEPQFQENVFIFSRFMTRESVFDTVEASIASRDLSQLRGKKNLIFPYEAVEFKLRYFFKKGYHVIENLIIDENKNYSPIKRAYLTNSSGEVIKDITEKRTKPVTPGLGFGKRIIPPSEEDLKILNRLYKK